MMPQVGQILESNLKNTSGKMCSGLVMDKNVLAIIPKAIFGVTTTLLITQNTPTPYLERSLVVGTCFGAVLL